MDESTRKSRIDELLHIIGGCEVVLLGAQDDFKLRRTVEQTKQEKIKELRDIVYGLG